MSATNDPGWVIWLRGFSGAGKSTLAGRLVRTLHAEGYRAQLIDEPPTSQREITDPAFDLAVFRERVLRLMFEAAGAFASAGDIVVGSIMITRRAQLEMARRCAPVGRFVELHLATSLDECRARDPKGLYRRLDAGEHVSIPGVTADYEPPVPPAIRVETDGRSVTQTHDELWDRLGRLGIVDADRSTRADVGVG